MRRTHWFLVSLGLALAAPAPALAHGASQGPPPTDALGIALAWHVDPTLILALALAAAVYVSAARSVDAAHPGNRWPRRRTTAFVAGIVAVGLALLSPVDTLSDDLLTVHMVQHLLLVAVAAPLFAASGIGTLALRAASADVRQRYLLPFLHSRVISALTFPVVGWLAFAGVMWGSHFSTLYNAALFDDGVHAIEHLLYLTAAALFWWPLLSPDPLRWRLHPGAKLLALLAQMPPMSFLAVTIIGAATPLYAAYLGRTDAFGIDALSDQRVAGSLMWLTGDLAFLIPGAVLLAAFVRHDEAEAKRADARLDRERQTLSRKES
ncbi:MAG: cytochrome c oxidase assembly protein [Candidatus Limnocylindrales bacterium]